MSTSQRQFLAQVADRVAENYGWRPDTVYEFNGGVQVSIWDAELRPKRVYILRIEGGEDSIRVYSRYASRVIARVAITEER